MLHPDPHTVQDVFPVRVQGIVLKIGVSFTRRLPRVDNKQYLFNRARLVSFGSHSNPVTFCKAHPPTPPQISSLKGGLKHQNMQERTVLVALSLTILIISQEFSFKKNSSLHLLLIFLTKKAPNQVHPGYWPGSGALNITLEMLVFIHRLIALH